MITALKTASILLSYPSQEIHSALPGLIEILTAGNQAKKRETKLLAELARDIADSELYDAQERYVFLFDRTRSLSLHLFEHVHGESRDRGQAMVDLMAVYEENGLSIDEKELPDYLPLFLEYLATRTESEAQEMLSQTLHIVSALRKRLKKRKSIYANVFLALEAFANSKPDQGLVKSILARPEDDPEDLDALDAIWEEEAVTFGGNAGENACGPDRLQRQVRASRRKPENLENNPNATPNAGEAQ
ncbi:MAG: nitrate reductase molybdenum cofactor assembly chaperone [Rhizobiaceae bacterium]